MALFLGAVALISLREYYHIVFNGSPQAAGGIRIIGYVSGLAIIWGAYVLSFDIIAASITFNFLISGMVSITWFKADQGVAGMLHKQITGLLYVPLLIAFLLLLRNHPQGCDWFFLILVVVFANDTGAFYTGTFIGKNKLCPSVSPGKTIEGSIGGIIAGILGGSILQYYLLPELSWVISIPLFLCTGAAGQAGDLFESMLKRRSGVKDSGTLLPGHGGMLDRIDALLFAAPVVYLFREYLL